MKSESGFTLIEIIIVIALVALIAITTVPKMTSYYKVSINSAAREIATTVKETYNATMVTGQIHRLVYDMKAGQYWVEYGTGQVLIDTAESKKIEEMRLKFSKAKENQASPFSMDLSVTRKKLTLPSGVKFQDIMNEQSAEPIQEGVAYTHIFPSGMTEQTIIHLADNSENKASLVIPPLVGSTDLYQRYVSRNEAFGK